MSPGVDYDSKRGRVIVFGEMGASGFLGDSWELDGTSWKRVP